MTNREGVHILSREGACSCGEFAADLADPRFTDLALAHLDEVVDRQMARDQRVALLWMVAAVAISALIVATVLLLVAGR
jgi:hypothetical protein